MRTLLKQPAAITTQVARQIIQARNSLLGKLDMALNKFDLTAAQYGVLDSLAEAEEATAGQLCQRLNYDKGAMSRMLVRLEKKKLITRLVQKEDARVFNLALSTSGVAMFPSARSCVDKVYADVFAHISGNELNTLQSVLANTLTTRK